VSAASLTTLINQVGPAKVTGFFLVLARVAPLFVLAPLFSSKMMPARVRSVVAIGVAIGLTPVALQGQRVPTDVLSVVALMVEQILVGLAFSLAVGAVLSAVEAAGDLIDLSSGFSYGAILNPLTGNTGGTMSNLYGMVGLALFLAIGGDAWVLHGIGHTFDLVPLTRAPAIATLTTGVEQAFGSIFVGALEVAAPVLLTLFITDIAFGMVSRVVPQLNIFGVGLPLKIGVAVIIVTASLPFLGGYMSNAVANSVTGFLNVL
jgi:flagellar biosynthetic protein FliR